MRDIKFRGKRLDNGEWVCGYFAMIMREKPRPGKLTPRVDFCIYANDGEWYKVDPETVGQYTGLTDKGGKEIYEGDIIKTDFSYATWIGFVHFNKGNFELVDSDKNGQYLTLSVLSDIEIIGNIHDNPELLETK